MVARLYLTIMLCFTFNTQQGSLLTTQEILDTLPQHSWLRSELQASSSPSGKLLPYMEYMRGKSIRRAYFQVTTIWNAGKPGNVQVASAVYFDKYDGPYSQVQGSRLDQAAALDSIAIERSRTAPLVHGVDRPIVKHPDGQQMCTSVELFDDPKLPGSARPWYPCGKFGTLPLSEASAIGDANGVAQLLADQKFPQEKLDDALFHGVKNYYDNSEIIEILVKAGADINCRDSHYGSTVLMWALDKPIQLPTLIRLGADLTARDRNGNTALKLARSQGLNEAVQILREAGARE